MQIYTLKEDEDHDVFFAGPYSLNGRCKQVDCELKDHMLKAKVLGCFTELYIIMLSQLRTMPYLDLGTINRIREVCQRHLTEEKQAGRTSPLGPGGGHGH